METVQSRWMAHLQAIQTEGISVKAYAQREGIPVASLYHWRQRLKSAPPLIHSSPKLVAVQVGAPLAAPPAQCWIQLAGAMRMELNQLPPAAWLAQLAAAMINEAR